MPTTDAHKNLERELDECRRELANARQQLREMKAALAARKNSVELPRQLLDQLPAFVCLIRDDHSIVYANRFCQELFGDPLQSVCYSFFCNKHAPCTFCLLKGNSTSSFTRLRDLHDITGAYRTFQVTDRLFKTDDNTHLLLTIGIDISKRLDAEKNLRREKEELELRVEERADQLQRKNIALTEVLSQLEVEKQNLAEKVEVNVQKVLLPVIEKLIEKSSSMDKRYLMLIKQNLQNLTSSAGIKLAKTSYNLTPKEIELCTLIKGGFSIKEIATMHNLSERTVETHRLNIRRKLGLTSAKINLSAYLSNL